MGLRDDTLGQGPGPFGLVRVHGPDAVDYLQRTCSQDVQGLAPGACAPAAFLDSKGKLLFTCLVAREAEGAWLETEAARAAPLAEHLERYHFTEDLVVDPVTGLECRQLAGFAACAHAGVAPGTFHDCGGGIVLAFERGGVQWVRMHAPPGAAPPWPAETPALDEETADCLRILAALPRLGVDTDARTLALEAGLDDHVSTTKGCYTGQEIIARIHTYGHLNRKLRVLEIEGEAAVEPGTHLLEPEENAPVGRVLSNTRVPGEPRRLALGYLPLAFAAGAILRLPDARAVRVAAN